MSSLGADPFVERLRDALGTLRSAYAAASDARSKTALRKAGDEVAAALDVAQGRRREKELASKLRAARRSMEAAAQDAPWAAPSILGALARLPQMRDHW